MENGTTFKVGDRVRHGVVKTEGIVEGISDTFISVRLNMPSGKDTVLAWHILDVQLIDQRWPGETPEVTLPYADSAWGDALTELAETDAPAPASLTNGILFTTGGGSIAINSLIEELLAVIDVIPAFVVDVRPDKIIEVGPMYIKESDRIIDLEECLKSINRIAMELHRGEPR